MMRQTTWLILAVGALLALSLTMLASATMLDRNPEASLKNQIAATAIGGVGLVAMIGLGYRRVLNLAWMGYLGTLVLLVLVLSPLGRMTNGARRWLFGMQPSEFAKLALILILTWYAAKSLPKIRHFWRGLVIPGFLALPFVILIFAQPDRGTGIALLMITAVILVLAGARMFYLVPIASVALVGVVVILKFSSLGSTRIDAWLNPEKHRHGAAHQFWKAMHAFSEGGLEGRGLGRGFLKYSVPEVHTDFILPAVAEELGLGATLGVLGAYLVILLCGVRIARDAPDIEGRILAGGISFMIAIQAAINIAVVTGSVPNTGMPLPFMSRGGSSVAVLLTAIGLLLSVAQAAATEPKAGRRRPATPLFEDMPAGKRAGTRRLKPSRVTE